MVKGDYVCVTFPQSKPFVATVLEVLAKGRTLVVTRQGCPLYVSASVCQPLGPEVLRVRLHRVRDCERKGL